MTKRLIQFFLLLICVFSFSIPAAAQSKAASYNLPRAVSLDGIVRNTFPDYYGKEAYHKLEIDGFYPIGWSRDGRFAYYVEPVDEACGCYFAELKIVDLRTDRVLWEFKNKPEERTNANGEPLEDDIQKLWKRNRKLFSEKLREHRIEPIARFALLGRTFSSGGKTYTTKLTAKKAFDDGFGLDRVRSVNLEISTPSLGKKTVYSGDEKGEMFLSPLESAVAGASKVHMRTEPRSS